MDTRTADTERAVTPVVGVALMLGIVVLLTATLGFAALGFEDSIEDNSTATIETEQISDREYRMTWRSGASSKYILLGGDTDDLKQDPEDVGDIDDIPEITDITEDDFFIANPGSQETLTLEGEGAITISTVHPQDRRDETSVVDTVVFST